MSMLEEVCEIESFRDCRDEPIPREKVGKILEAGRRAPSPGNVQSTEFIAVESDERKEMLYRATDDRRVREAPTAIIVVSDFSRMERRTGGDARDYCNAEVACAIQNMRIMAHSEGLASCWVSGFDQHMVGEKFDIPDQKKPLGIILLAYTDHPVPPSDKFKLTDICFYDVYGNQLESFFDKPGWRGLKREKRIQEKKAGGFLRKLKRKLT